MPNNAFIGISDAVARPRQHPGGGIQHVLACRKPPTRSEPRDPVQPDSMAQPLLSDPEWVRKSATDRSEKINTCLACNQTCLVHAFAKNGVLPPSRAQDATNAVPGPAHPLSGRHRDRSGRTGRSGDHHPARAPDNIISRPMISSAASSTWPAAVPTTKNLTKPSATAQRCWKNTV